MCVWLDVSRSLSSYFVVVVVVMQVDWQMKGYAYWVRFIHVELLGGASTIPVIKVGDTVRVKPSVVTPQYKWGSITHSSVGVVTGEWSEPDERSRLDRP